ncbi:MAG: hypothetical protein CSA65_01505 [Proteobacteria bacterium]|nr:MAG: hypothetical protein CSB49_03175 [Pseudomonadota bacterium]PIE19687.1 MAG: hypothetical protein CSA65_01505 [Pseudomonadota bacterium]
MMSTTTITRLAALSASLTLLVAGCKEDNRKKHQLPSKPIISKASTKPATKPSAQTPSPVKPKTTEATADKALKGLSRVTGAGLLNGTTIAARTTQLTPQTSAVVTKVLFKQGDVVEKGQLLVQLDRTDYLLGLRQAQAMRDVALAGLDAVRIEWKRLRGLVKAKAIPSGQFDKVNSQLKVSQAQLAQAKVAIAGARRALSKTAIRAPFRAVVTKKMTEVGAYAAMMPPMPVVMLEEIDPIEIVLQVPEAQVSQVEKGTPVELTLSAIGKTLRARVDRVVPSLDQRTRAFSAFIRLANPGHRLRPGMFVEARLLTGAAKTSATKQPKRKGKGK